MKQQLTALSHDFAVSLAAIPVDETYAKGAVNRHCFLEGCLNVHAARLSRFVGLAVVTIVSPVGDRHGNAAKLIYLK
jgi:hypothetical protein